MAFTYDLTTDVGKVRLQIADTDSTDPWFEDAEIEVFLSRENDDLDLAASRALRAMAALFQDKMEQMGHWTEDMRGAVDSILMQAKSLEDRVAHPPAEATAEVAQVAWTPFVRRAIAIKDSLQ